MSDKVKVTEEGLRKVLDTMVEAFTDERQKTEPYKEMFKAGSSFTGLLREVEHKTMGHILDACDVLDKKGYSTNNEVFDFLLALPYVSHKLEKHIQETEGSACCVDKSFFLLSEHLKKLATKGGN